MPRSALENAMPARHCALCMRSLASMSQDYEGGIIDEKEFMDKLPEVAKLAISDACTGSNPRIPQNSPSKINSAAAFLCTEKRVSTKIEE